ncbi:Hypothetical predicted protein [Marmota monax]|uniref:Uncharacterized protein n=1 Tax=Marmota monax TaxID=9995 RepID=A0A5E4A9C4_MARMO|nr:hypothetical protein GHT09_015990 [Marmota monax]VTJ53659.1 Hypothetical predicted protein [Marmota monax]
MASRARIRHGARASPPVRPPPILPRASAPARQLQRSARPQPHPFSGCPRLSRLPSPEVDVAARRRERGGGGSASGETGPGLVFVNLPRSRRGQRRPQGWHGVLGPEGGAALLGRQREVVPGRFLEQIKRIQLENQD